MNSPTLSIVIPVYNVAAVLPACLDALQAQSRAPDEIIAIDDGATDDSLAVLQHYAQRMSCLKIVAQANQGRSKARNLGLSLATGDYLAFIDSDDIPSPDYCRKLMDIACADDLDIAIANGDYYYEGRQPDRPIFRQPFDSGLISGAEWLKNRLARNDMLHVVWLHLYRRSFLLQYGFAFPADRLYEDVSWTTRAMLLAQRVRSIPDSIYRYRIAERRSSGAAWQKHLEIVISSSEANAAELEAMLPLTAHDPELTRLVRWQIVDGALSVFHRIEQLPDKTSRRPHLARLRENGFLARLWRNAQGFTQHKRIARGWLKSFLGNRQK
ncbi:MAG TPA: glycosyltransferase [Rhodocyclaceae bacterium]|nr:glycosyltransferase [Rhodocyclaceae bacterium]